MAKKSRRERKQLREQELKTVDTNKKQRCGYKRRKIRVCSHYSFSALIKGYVKTYLEPTDSGEYVCSECGKVFTSEQAGRLENMCRYLLTDGEKSAETLAEYLKPDIMPSEYYYVALNTPEVCGTIESDLENLIRNYNSKRMKTKIETLKFLELLRQKALDGTLQGKTKSYIFEPDIISDSEVSWDGRVYLRSHKYNPDYNLESLIELIKHSESAEDAYKKIGQELSIFKSDIKNKHLFMPRIKRKILKDYLDEMYPEKESYINEPIKEDLPREVPEFENIFFKEDCFEYLLQKGFDYESAYKVMIEFAYEAPSIISKRYYINNIDIYNNGPRFIRPPKLSAEFYEWAEKVHYLPGRDLIYEIFSVE